jgi:ubiquinone/menaquinone biosynthesis C-methylase UbiE
MQNKEAEKEFFDNACVTSPWVTFNKNGQDAILNLFVKHVQPKKGERAIDMGCGTGEFSNKLNQFGLQVTGLDISEKSIRHCKEKYGESITFETKDIENTGFPDNSVDIIFFGGILHHFPNSEKVFAEAHRILKKGGRVFAFDPNYYNLIIWTYRELLGVQKQKTENEVLMKAEQIKEKLKKANFTEMNVKSSANITFDIQYFQKLVPFPLYYGVYVYNLIERSMNIIKPVREKYGSFVITYGRK